MRHGRKLRTDSNEPVPVGTVLAEITSLQVSSYDSSPPSFIANAFQQLDERRKQPDQCGKNRQDDHYRNTDQQSKESLVRSRSIRARIRMAAQKSEIPKIGFISRVENVAGERNCSKECVQDDVRYHAEQRTPRHFESGRLEYYICANGQSTDIPDAGDEPEQRIVADAIAQQRNPDGIIHQHGEPIKSTEPLLLAGCHELIACAVGHSPDSTVVREM